MQKASKEHRLREQLGVWFHKYGTTWKAWSGGRSLAFTADPRNVQTILALKFKDFEFGKYRNEGFRPLLGYGIFSTDGSMWEHSRAMLRPNFARNQITDIEIYERHVSALIKNIPRDGSTFDLQELFFCMVFLTDYVFVDITDHINRPSILLPNFYSVNQFALSRTLQLVRRTRSHLPSTSISHKRV